MYRLRSTIPAISGRTCGRAMTLLRLGGLVLDGGVDYGSISCTQRNTAALDNVARTLALGGS